MKYFTFPLSGMRKEAGGLELPIEYKPVTGRRARRQQDEEMYRRTKYNETLNNMRRAFMNEQNEGVASYNRWLARNNLRQLPSMPNPVSWEDMKSGRYDRDPRMFAVIPRTNQRMAKREALLDKMRHYSLPKFFDDQIDRYGSGLESDVMGGDYDEFIK